MSSKKNPKSMNLDELRAYMSELKDSGKEESNSKEAAKVSDLIKIAKSKQGANYGKEEMAAAYTNLSRGVTDKTGWTAQNAADIQAATGSLPDLVTGTPVTQLGVSSPAQTSGSSITPDSSSSILEKQLADKQKALTVAMSNINDNPWYSEATRTGKLAKLNDVAQVDIGNLQAQINAQKAAQQQVFENNLKVQQLAAQTQQQQFENSLATQKFDLEKQPKTTKTAASSGGSSSKNNLSYTKYFDQAVDMVKRVDTMNYGTADKKLSSWEEDYLLEAIRSLVNNNEELAQQLFGDVTAGYGHWEG